MHILDNSDSSIHTLIDLHPISILLLQFACVFLPDAIISLSAEECFGDYAVYGIGTREGDEGLGDLAHDAVCAAAVDEVDTVGMKGFGELAGGC
jgi:hypothetical protein